MEVREIWYDGRRYALYSRPVSTDPRWPVWVDTEERRVWLHEVGEFGRPLFETTVDNWKAYKELEAKILANPELYLMEGAL